METQPTPTSIEPQIEHQNVPEAHRGLHDFLYSSDDEHGAVVKSPIAIPTGDTVMSLQDWFEVTGDVKVAGVYGVLDCDRQLQYVNISRNVSLSLRSHQSQLGSELCASVRVFPFRSPKRDEMMAVQSAWIAENGTTPIGNLDDDNPWANATGAAAIAAMTPAERAAYEEKKLKLRSAMADSTLNREKAAATNAEGDRDNLEQAMQSDDWSSVINAQTQDTL
jgi:hypothetical protein